MPWPSQFFMHALAACREQCIALPGDKQSDCNALATPCLASLPRPVTSNQLAMPWPPLVLACRVSCLGQYWFKFFVNVMPDGD
ncbi:hypothetical protein RHGRI_005007 [Rhododendron griersonianum]|uniref:Secreted protein n=1 Tax=Rhododendron griersonianum TaxID=479676 RepID=A0AAV6LBQ2_9ERIC|nr:hypothetical protein RHGRI_005007 [Rhododendron griersonianum]